VCGVLTRIAVTHANILASLRSTVARAFRFAAQRMLSYRRIPRYRSEFLNF